MRQNISGLGHVCVTPDVPISPQGNRSTKFASISLDFSLHPNGPTTFEAQRPHLLAQQVLNPHMLYENKSYNDCHRLHRTQPGMKMVQRNCKEARDRRSHHTPELIQSGHVLYIYSLPMITLGHKGTCDLIV